MNKSRGYTLIELIVAVGLFALVMTLAAGAYLIMISVGRSSQATSTGINSLAFALEDMTRSVRTGTAYNCNAISGGDCTGGGTTFYFTDPSNTAESYARSNSSNYCGSSGSGCIVKTVNGNTYSITDPSVNISSLTFYVSGTSKADSQQPHVTFIITGTTSSGPGKTTTFSVETGATMRGADL